MDEPLSNLDALLRVQTRVELMRLHQRLGTTTVYVTHDQVEAMTMGHRIAVLRDGVLQQLGTPDDVYNRPANAFVATFIGAPSMNLVRGRLVEAGRGTWRVEGQGFGVAIEPSVLGVDASALERASEGTVDLGIRPEAFRLAATGGDGMAGRVQLLEPVGSDLYLTIEAAGTVLQVRTAPDARVTIDENLTLEFDLAKCHLFGADGRSLRYGAEAPPAEPAVEVSEPVLTDVGTG
jgi:multiple sugar transport system ATP-binding protein